MDLYTKEEMDMGVNHGDNDEPRKRTPEEDKWMQTDRELQGAIKRMNIALNNAENSANEAKNKLQALIVKGNLVGTLRMMQSDIMWQQMMRGL